MALYETLPYQVLESFGTIELRQYDDHMLASTKTTINRKEDSGFNNVFNYIAGANDKQTKIKMTTPVVTHVEEGQLVTSFYVPSKYDKTTVPKPVGGRVYIEENTSSLYLVITFKGRSKRVNFDKHDQQLLKFIEEHPFDIISERLVFQYQPPFIPGVFRRNEVAYRVKRAM